MGSALISKIRKQRHEKEAGGSCQGTKESGFVEKGEVEEHHSDLPGAKGKAVNRRLSVK